MSNHHFILLRASDLLLSADGAPLRVDRVRVGRALLASVRKHGVVEPLIVTRHGDAYALAHGFKRLASLLRAGRAGMDVPVIEVENELAVEIMKSTSSSWKASSKLSTRKADHALAEEAGRLLEAGGLSMAAAACLAVLPRAVQVEFLHANKHKRPTAAAARAFALARGARRFAAGALR